MEEHLVLTTFLLIIIDYLICTGCLRCIASPISSIKPLARTITSVFHLFFRQIQIYNDKCRFFTGVNTFWVVQNNKPVIDANEWA